MSIDELFKKYPDNIFGLRINSSEFKVIDFMIKKDWAIPEDKVSSETILKKQKDNDDGTIYYILYSNTTTFVDLFNIVSNIIEYNHEIEKKQDLFAQKMNELKRIFLETEFNDLKTLKFDLTTDKLISKKIDNAPVTVNKDDDK